MMWGEYGGGWGMHDGFRPAWLALGSLLVLLAVLAAAVVALVMRNPGSAGRQPIATQPSGADSQRVLQRRFAFGEIDEEEFRQRSRVLNDSTP